MACGLPTSAGKMLFSVDLAGNPARREDGDGDDQGLQRPK